MSPPSSTSGSVFRKRRLSLPNTAIAISDELKSCLEDLSESEQEQVSEIDNMSVDAGDAKKMKKTRVKASLVSKSIEARDIGYELSEDERLNLPFPKDIVGMYSCPGLEPIYGLPNLNEENNGEALVNCVAKINQDRGAVAYPYGATHKCALFAAFDGKNKTLQKYIDEAVNL